MMKELTNKDLAALKEKGLLEENEVAYIKGDKVVAENILTKATRIVETKGILLESNKKLLKG